MLNQRIVRKSYTFPRIDYTVQKLEGFQHDTESDLNIVYYTIELSTKIHDLTNIITKFGKFRYNRVPMGLCASGEIFQAKSEKILVDIKGVKTYINNIIVIVKGSLYQHIYHLIFIFARL